MFMATVPAGTKAGDTLAAVTPSGRAFRTVVPAGLKPGDKFVVHLKTTEDAFAKPEAMRRNVSGLNG
eukprot:4683438-Prymnesium_polylepis.1